MTTHQITVIDMSKRPNHVSHPTITELVQAMQRNDREELIHYAGASYRDDVAWRLCEFWVLNPGASEAQLKDWALASL